MRVSCPLALCGLVILLLAASLTVQVIALTTTHWAQFSARVDLGKQEERGHFGLWTVCSVKAPTWREDCDPMDTFYQLPPHALVAGAVGAVHLLQLVLLVPLVIVRAVQVARFTADIAIRSKILCIVNVAVAFLAVIFAILVAIFASVGEKKPEYTVKKSWSFWAQIAVIVSDFAVALLCAGENFRFWQLHVREHSDPWGHRSETYGNPAFDPGPIASDRGPIAFTTTSGAPPAGAMLTYENPSFQERSPALDKRSS